MEWEGGGSSEELTIPWHGLTSDPAGDTVHWQWNEHGVVLVVMHDGDWWMKEVDTRKNVSRLLDNLETLQRRFRSGVSALSDGRMKIHFWNDITDFVVKRHDMLLIYYVTIVIIIMFYYVLCVTCNILFIGNVQKLHLCLWKRNDIFLRKISSSFFKNESTL